ncbi:hypothetical protein SAY86_023528 [Trapa natans]|uniref:Mannosyltransferase n=1 Tax=Trapa natans TaxID=22666 RepID=A0AAN7LQ33_TRANT|nr:hypothetical protein SAY86_023528 [Trapa natans]
MVQELRFIIGSVPIFNLAAAVAASRIYNNRKKSFWKVLFLIMVGSFFVSLGCSGLTFLASYQNYHSGYALKYLHESGHLTKGIEQQWVHIDTFSAMNGISRFCEDENLLRYSKEEGIHIEDFRSRNFTYLVSEHAAVDGYKCLFSVKGFSRISLRNSFPPITLIIEPKVFVHGNLNYPDIVDKSWRGCS